MNPEPPTETRLYSLARRLASFMHRVFFQRVNLLGSSRIPLEGATLFVANHVNFLVDPMVLMAVVPRPLHFLAKAPLFRIPIVGRLRAKGLTLRAIADKLNRMGYATRRDRPWSPTQVARVLRRGQTSP